MKFEMMIFLLSISIIESASTKKKSTEETSPSSNSAIIAIEIVDSNDTSSDLHNNTKRTIESALGYGFQGNYYPTSTSNTQPQGKKYMVYPYSQKDIPPVVNVGKNEQLNIQKSVRYNLGTKTETVEHTKQLYSQGPVYMTSYPATLYSTVGQEGAIGGLSPHFPQQQASAATSIPVIILRVYTNQLSDPGAIYPNLPQSHPYANNLNSVNLQSIIANYLQQQMYQMQQIYKQPIYQSPTTNYQSYYQAQPQINYKYLEKSAAHLPTHENYPSDSHTRVIYHGPRGHIQGVRYTSAPQQEQNSQYVYMNSNGQNYIYVHPNQLQQDQQYYQQDYQQEYQQQDYQEPEYQQQEYQKPQEDRRYLPISQEIPQKVYNYHVDDSKDRSKKSSGSPVTFESSKIEEKNRS